jgi:hypothetical protein
MVKKRASKGSVKKPVQSKAAAPAKQRDKAKPAAVKQPEHRTTASAGPVPGVWLLPWMPQIVGGINNSAYILAWLVGVRLDDSASAAHYQRSVNGDVHIALKRVKLAELLGLAVGDVEQAIQHLREIGFITYRAQKDGDTKVTFFSLDLDAIRAAKASLSEGGAA